MTVRPTPLFLPTPGIPGYLAMNVYDKRSAWVGQGVGQAYRWWDGPHVKVIEGAVFAVAVVGTAANLDESKVIKTGLSAGAGLELVWAMVEAGMPHAAKVFAAYDHRMEQYAEPRGLPALEDGDYFLVGPGIGENEDGLEHLTLIPRRGMVYFDPPRGYLGILGLLTDLEIRGLLWSRIDANGDRQEATVFRADFGSEHALGDAETSGNDTA